MEETFKFLAEILGEFLKGVLEAFGEDLLKLTITKVRELIKGPENPEGWS